MWSFLIGLIDPVAKISKAIADTKIAMAAAATDQERIHAEERVATLQARRDVLIAEASQSRVNLYVRAALAAPVVIVLWKILVWDQTFQLGSTPALGDDMWKLIYIVTGFYFLYEGAVTITRSRGNAR